MVDQNSWKYIRGIGWLAFWILILIGSGFLASAIVNLGITVDSPKDQPGYQTFTIAYVALRLGVAVCFFVLALAIRPRK